MELGMNPVAKCHFGEFVAAQLYAKHWCTITVIT